MKTPPRKMNSIERNQKFHQLQVDMVTWQTGKRETYNRIFLCPNDFLVHLKKQNRIRNKHVEILGPERLQNLTYVNPNELLRENPHISEHDKKFYIVDSMTTEDPYPFVRKAKEWFWRGQEESGSAFIAFLKEHYRHRDAHFFDEPKISGMELDLTNPGWLEYLLNAGKQPNERK